MPQLSMDVTDSASSLIRALGSGTGPSFTSTVRGRGSAPKSSCTSAYDLNWAGMPSRRQRSQVVPHGPQKSQ